MIETLLEFSQSTGIYGFMNSAWGWPIAESLHFVGLCLIIGTVGVFDLRLMGLAKATPLKALHRLVPLGQRPISTCSIRPCKPSCCSC
jgi:hypothetical protein